MNIKKAAGLLWMLIGPVTIFILLSGAIKNISVGGQGDIHKPLPWIIIITIFTPVAIGLVIFGWYAWKGEYEETQQKS
jgi:hypothetical protein